MKIKFFTTGGTIDKVYFDKKCEFQVGEPQIRDVLNLANVTFDYDIEQILRKDSLDMTPEDREVIFEAIQKETSRHIIITHGTDTMVETALRLRDIPEKTIILTGAMAPALFRDSDAMFNVGVAVAAVQTLPNGVYIVMNGMVFDPRKTKKNAVLNRFEQA